MSSSSRFAIAAAIGLLFSTDTLLAQTAPPPGQPIGFEQFRAQQLQQLQRAQARLAQRLSAPDLPPDQRQRLEHRQAQLGTIAALPPDQRDQVLRRRFDRIDANHDGAIDAGELQALRQAHQDRAQAKKASSGPDGKSDDFWPSQSQN